MGGFAGGDEGGYWEEDTLTTLVDKQSNTNQKKKEKAYQETNDLGYSIKAYAKVNDKNPHILDNLYDIVSFIPCACTSFTIEGCDEIPLKSNTIYQAYKKILDFTNDTEVLEFFSEYKVVVKKCIPFHPDQGGNASNAAAFLYLLKEVCNLILSTDELVEIGNSIDTDVPFFLYNYL